MKIDTAIGILCILIILGFLSTTCSGSAETLDSPQFLINIPATIDPLDSLEFDIKGAPILSHDGINYDELYYILKSEETGHYPNWGWTGTYYKTEVTHGNPINIELDNSSVVPESSTFIIIVILFLMIYLRRLRKTKI